MEDCEIKNNEKANSREELFKKVASAFINWNMSKAEVIDILCKDGLEREEAYNIVETGIPILNASRRKTAIKNIILGFIISFLGIGLLYWTASLRARVKWVLWGLLFLGFENVYKGIKLLKLRYE